MRVYLVRHGEAVSEHVDPQRPLSDKGHLDIAKIAGALKDRQVSVTCIFHSGKKRAHQTAQIIRDAVNPGCKLVAKDCLAPNDSTDAIYEEVSQQKQNLIIVGHLPFLSHLASRLVTGGEDIEVVKFGAGCVVAFEKREGGAWKIIWSVSPQQVRK